MFKNALDDNYTCSTVAGHSETEEVNMSIKYTYYFFKVLLHVSHCITSYHLLYTVLLL